jgi:hypothetical protein
MHACLDGWIHGRMQIEQLHAAGLIKGGSLKNFLLSAGMLLSNVIVSNGFSQNPSAEYKIITIVR